MEIWVKYSLFNLGANSMAKGLERTKEAKKQPTKTMKEKKAAKKEKKEKKG